MGFIHGLLNVVLSYDVRQVKSGNGHTVSLGIQGNSRIRACSNKLKLHLYELKSREIVRSQRAEEILHVHRILMAQENILRSRMNINF